MIIYKITNLLSGKIYVGKDSKNDPKYYGSGIFIRRAILKYGIDNFSKEIIQFCDSLDELNEMEKHWIKKLDSRNPVIGYNISEGGEGFNLKNLPNYDEIKEKMSNSPHLKKSYVEKYGINRANKIIEKKSRTYKENSKTTGDMNSSKRPDVREKISRGVKKYLDENPSAIDEFKNRQKKIIDDRRGKNFTEIYGKERADEMIRKISVSKIGDLNPAKRLEVRDKIKEGVRKHIETISSVPVWSFLEIISEREHLVGRGKLKFFCESNGLSLSKIKYRLSKSSSFVFSGWIITKF
jgi:hypothetical protein